MRPERKSQVLLGITRAKAKMFEYGVPEEHHIQIPRDPAKLFPLAIGLLGDLAATSCDADSAEDFLGELRKNLHFSSRFFDAYHQAQLNDSLDPYLLLLGAAAYYLCDLPGSSLVLARHLGEGCPDLGGWGLEHLLVWLLHGDWSTYTDESDGPYGKDIDAISQAMVRFFAGGSESESLFKKAMGLRKAVYANGTPRQLLFADLISAVVKKRFENSTWCCLPEYTGLPVQLWQPVLQKKSFMRELWPAQRLLGKHGIFRGESAVVQMPTSAGKTKATQIIIRSAFLAHRTSLAVVVAPFRALCQEIRNSLIEVFRDEQIGVDELTDVLQADFEVTELLQTTCVLVATPEKLIYVLRHAPELAEKIGLLIYDEGHQFDRGERGITYELLLTSLKSMVPKGAQTILLSAVISNAKAVGDWLNGSASQVVSGTSLIPTYRSVAFASWLDNQGRKLSVGWLRFGDPNRKDDYEFFVPRIIEQQQLKRRKEGFPSMKADDRGKETSLYLGLRLSHRGSVAIFCGRKDTASGLCETVLEAYNKGLTIPCPRTYSSEEEIGRLHFLHACNLGNDATMTQCAALGIFAHHRNTPHGIRLAIEHALKKRQASFVICTSTLAQGVNLPIRYLIVTSVYQGSEPMMVRDFHNLIGRAGRAGIHTEGSILFADPSVYDKRTSPTENWRWKQVKEMLEPSNSEPCASALLSLFEPLHSDDRKYEIPMAPLDFVRAYIEGATAMASLLRGIASQHADKGFSIGGLEQQVSHKTGIISSIESYLMSNWEEVDSAVREEDTIGLAKGTLAYFLAASEELRAQVVELFQLLGQNILRNVPDPSKRRVYGRTLYGVRAAIDIENWVNENIRELSSSDSHDDLLAALWSIMAKNIENNTFKKCDHPEVLKDVALRWIKGKSFHDLLAILVAADAKLIWGQKRREFKTDHIVDVCENGLAYDGTLVVGAVIELVALLYPEDSEDLIAMLQGLQKRLKYGLPSSSAVILYELGFADRVVSIHLSEVLVQYRCRNGEFCVESGGTKPKCGRC